MPQLRNILYSSLIDLNDSSGAVEHVLEISRGLAQEGHHVRLVAGYSGAVPRTDGSFDLHPIRLDGVGPVRSARLTAKRTLALARENRPDIVYLRSFPMDAVLLAQPLARMDVPFVCEINTAMGPEYAARGRPLRGRLYDSFQGRTLSKSAGWLVMTPELTAYAERLSGTSKPSLVAKNGFNPSRTAPQATREEARRRLEVDPEALVLVMAGFSRPWHGADRAVDMLTELPQGTLLWLVGSRGPADVASIRSHAEDRGVAQSLKVFSWLGDAALSELIVAADVGLGPLALDRKQMSEAQPLKVPLYLALGVPVLVNYTDVRLDSAGSFVKYVSSRDPKVLAAGAQDLLDDSQTRPKEAKDFAHQNLTWQAAARETSEFLAEVLGSLGR